MAGFPAIHSVLLVGFMGSGKTTVGRLLARSLGWTFLDFDQELEVRLGKGIASVFEEEGERYFRERESEVGRELLTKTGVVLASGGGWPVRAENWATVQDGTLSVWLDVTPERVLERLSEEAAIRPLLAKNDPFDQARTLMSERKTAYERADCRVVTDDMTPLQVAIEIEDLVKNSSNEDQRSERMSN